MTEPIDTLFVDCRELVTLTGGPPTGARTAGGFDGLGVIPDGAVGVRDGRIVAVGPRAEVEARVRPRHRESLDGAVVFPGFVDCHTHPVFAATREDEFHQRCAGADYMAIAAAGGGILSSVRAVRAASRDELAAWTRRHLDAFLEHGTTTIEAKSGYGLSTESELQSLDALADAAADHPVTVRPTFLGAHEVPPEYRDRRDAYVDLVIDEMLPAVQDRCVAADVFAEPKVFDLAQSRRILTAAKDLGLGLRVHADEIEPMGGAELAVELGAESADHLPMVSEAGIRALAASETTAVLLPGTSFYLGKSRHAPARALLDAGARVALSTDFNPGSCHTMSLPLIVTLACVLLHMTPEECIAAITINAAASLRLDADRGTLHPGKRADLVALDLPSWRGIGYVFGGNPVVATVVGGAVVHRGTSRRFARG